MKKINKETKLRKEINSWKETCEIISDKSIMSSIQKSLKEISEGKGIPLSKL